jgi:hypothetical protein
MAKIPADKMDEFKKNSSTFVMPFMKKVKDLSFYIGKHLGLCRDSGVADNHS